MLFRIEFRRLIFRWQMYLAIAIGIALVIIQIITINKINAFWYNNAFTHMIGYDNSGLGTQLYVVLLPIMCGLAGSSIIQEDKKNKMIDTIIARTSKIKYLRSSLLSSFLIGGLVGLFPLLVEAIIYFSKYKITVLPAKPEFYLIRPNNSFEYQLFSTHPLIFWIFYLIIIFIFSGLFAQLGLISIYFDIYRGVETVIPFLILFISIVLGDFLKNDNISLQELIIPTYGSWSNGTIYGILFYFILFTGIILILTWRKCNHDNIS
ncbi:hypothetical protein J2Z60_001547 [Lactobacillus colini]|uniref:ABC transporter permease n=1 Tax=Lactobacillus colini TaxID=1819254 RepID=A0ABS4MFC4_9LACO|nr:hypothetical protein [Lactobacillus colini]MBP2058368.1 hypothetical protein [Lactobacillus colini]